MALTSTPTITRIKEGTGTLTGRHSSTYTKTVSFPVTTSISSDGYYTGDTINLGAIIPMGTAITGLWYKVSTSQGATLTFAPSLDAQAAFVSAINLTSTSFAPLTVVAGNALAGTADASVKILLAGTTVGCTAATITLCFALAVIDGAAGATTYTT